MSISESAVQRALYNLRRIEGVRKDIPCPGGKRGCCVRHFVLSPGPLELMLRGDLGLPLKEDKS
jgi:hypothetical protein